MTRASEVLKKLDEEYVPPGSLKPSDLLRDLIKYTEIKSKTEYPLMAFGREWKNNPTLKLFDKFASKSEYPKDKGKTHRCYDDAYMLATKYPDKLKLVVGYVISIYQLRRMINDIENPNYEYPGHNLPFPTPHAWVVNKSNEIIDITLSSWKDDIEAGMYVGKIVDVNDFDGGFVGSNSVLKYVNNLFI